MAESSVVASLGRWWNPLGPARLTVVFCFLLTGSLLSPHLHAAVLLGAPLGGEFRVNTGTAGHQRWPSVASDAQGNVIVVPD